MLHRSRFRRRDKPQATVDMTSLIDLTFLLLVTFIITLPALEQGVSILLPQGRTDELPTKDRKATTVTVNAQNQIFLDNRPVTAEVLEAALKEMAAQDPDVPVLVRGDVRLDYGSIMDVVKIVYKCRVRRMALVTLEK